ncbi:MAG: hypothetical protein Q7U47_04675 [Paludibacter sp.]|nr:hypothetical protein [Paludibacter sp.]
MPTHKAYTFASRTSPDTNQSLQKSMLSPTQRKNKKSTLLKNKTFQTHNPTDKNVMTELIVNNKGMSLEKKEGQLVTKCICHKGFSGYSSVVARSNFRVGRQETAPQSLTAHTLDRYQTCIEKKEIQSEMHKLTNLLLV